MEIVYISKDDLARNPNNARVHDKAQILNLRRSIREFGFINPLIVQGNQIVAGHGRYEAGVAEGMEEFPCYPVDNLTVEQAAALALADNKIGQMSHWDADKLNQELADMRVAGLDIEVTGFTNEEIEEISEEPGAEETEVKVESSGENRTAKSKYIHAAGRRFILSTSELKRFETFSRRYTKKFGTINGIFEYMLRLFKK